MNARCPLVVNLDVECFGPKYSLVVQKNLKHLRICLLQRLSNVKVKWNYRVVSWKPNSCISEALWLNDSFVEAQLLYNRISKILIASWGSMVVYLENSMAGLYSEIVMI